LTVFNLNILLFLAYNIFLFGERNQISETSVEKPNSDSGMTADNSCYQAWNNSTKSENKDIDNKGTCTCMAIYGIFLFFV
jgi:hypothetical protein